MSLEKTQRIIKTQPSDTFSGSTMEKTPGRADQGPATESQELDCEKHLGSYGHNGDSREIKAQTRS